MDEERLQEIEARQKEAAIYPFPWRVETGRAPGEDIWRVVDAAGEVVFDCSFADYEGGGSPPSDEVLAFLLSAGPDVLALVEALRGARAQAAEAVEAAFRAERALEACRAKHQITLRQLDRLGLQLLEPQPEVTPADWMGDVKGIG